MIRIANRTVRFFGLVLFFGIVAYAEIPRSVSQPVGNVPEAVPRWFTGPELIPPPDDDNNCVVWRDGEVWNVPCEPDDPDPVDPGVHEALFVPSGQAPAPSARGRFIIMCEGRFRFCATKNRASGRGFPCSYSLVLE